MASFAIHDFSGNIKSVVRSSVGAPPVAAPPGLFVTKIELPQEFFDFVSSDRERGVAEALKSYCIYQGKVIRRS